KPERLACLLHALHNCIGFCFPCGSIIVIAKFLEHTILDFETKMTIYSLLYSKSACGTALSYSRRSLFTSFLIGFSIGISTVAYIFMNYSAVCLEQRLTLFSLDQSQRHKGPSYENGGFNI
ncbi:hypothetical protein AHF37_10634, partial [Paragonimus kellicotti]